MTSREITTSVILGMAHCLLGSVLAGAVVALVLVLLVRAMG